MKSLFMDSLRTEQYLHLLGHSFRIIYWSRIQKYLRHSYVSNHHCDVNVVVSDGTVAINRLMVILLFPEVLHTCDNNVLELVIVPDYTLDQIEDNVKE